MVAAECQGRPSSRGVSGEPSCFFCLADATYAHAVKIAEGHPPAPSYGSTPRYPISRGQGPAGVAAGRVLDGPPAAGDAAVPRIRPAGHGDRQLRVRSHPRRAGLACAAPPGVVPGRARCWSGSTPTSARRCTSGGSRAAASTSSTPWRVPRARGRRATRPLHDRRTWMKRRPAVRHSCVR